MGMREAAPLPAPFLRRRAIRLLAFAAFLLCVFGIPILAATVLRDSGPLVQSIVLPGLLFAAILIGFNFSRSDPR